MRTQRPLSLMTSIAVTVAFLQVSAAADGRASRRPCAATVPTGGSIQRVLDRASKGSVICLVGRYSLGAAIVPKAGMVLRGPAELIAMPGVVQGIDATKAANVRLIALDIHGFGERAFKCGPRSVVRDSYFHDNDRNGMGGGGCHGMLVEGNEFAYNGSLSDLGSGAAGIKVAGSRNVTIRGNVVHDNVGVGIWCDADCRDWLVEDNRAYRNTRKGIFFEKGDGAVIRYNVTRRNNSSHQRVGGGIGTVSSVDVEIYGNTLGANGEHGIKAWDDSRGYVLSRVRIYDNDLGGDDIAGCSETDTRCWSNRNVGA